MTRHLRHRRSAIAVLSVASAAFCFLLGGCQIGNEPSRTQDLQGVWEGTYTRTDHFGTDSALTQEGSATFRFTGTEYSCYGEEFYLPPGGAGNYRISDSKIILTDLAGHTAEFDWSLILSGEFDYSFDGKNLTLTQHDTKRERFHRATLTKLENIP